MQLFLFLARTRVQRWGGEAMVAQPSAPFG